MAANPAHARFSWFTKDSLHLLHRLILLRIAMFNEPFSICPRVFLSNEIIAATVETLVLFNITGLVNANYPQCDCHYLVADESNSSPANVPSFSYLALCLDGTGEWKSPTINPDGSEVKIPGLCDQLDGFFEYAGALKGCEWLSWLLSSIHVSLVLLFPTH